MGIYVSVNSQLAFSRETTFGRKVAPARLMGITSQGFEMPDLDRDLGVYTSFGDGARKTAVIEKRREYPASIPFLPVTGEFFYYWFGQDSFTAGSPNTHVMAPYEGPTPPSMTFGSVLKGSPNFQRLYPGLVVDGGSASLSEASELQCNMDVQARTVRDWDVATPTLFTQPSTTGKRPYMFYDRQAKMTMMGTYNYSTNAITGGRTIAMLKSFNIGMRRNLKAHYVSSDGDTTVLTGTLTLTNGSANVTGVGTAFTTELLQGDLIRVSGATAVYMVESITNNTALVLTQTFGETTVSGGTVYRVDAEANEPFAFTWGAPDFDLSVDVVVRGKRSTDTDAVYDLLQRGTQGDILIPFYRGSSDRLDFVFDDCVIKAAGHGFEDGGGETVVTCTIQPSETRCVVRDTIAQYSTL